MRAEAEAYQVGFWAIMNWFNLTVSKNGLSLVLNVIRHWGGKENIGGGLAVLIGGVLD